MTSSTTSPAARQAAMPFIMAAVLIDMLAIGIIIPVLPAMVGKFTGSQTDQVFWFGVASFAFGLANFFASPILGALSDQYGRRSVLLIGFLGLTLSFFGTALATSIGMLVAVRFMGGAMQANVSVSNAYVADISTAEQRAKRFGMLGAMFGLGFIVGPVMGGLLGVVDLRLPFVVAGSLAVVNLLYGWLVLPESLPLAQRKKIVWRNVNPWTALSRLADLRGVGPLVGIVAFSSLAQFVLYSTWVLYTSFKFGWSPSDNGWALAAVGAASVVMQGLLMGKLVKRFPPERLAVFGLVSSTVAYLLYGMATSGWMMYAIISANLLSFVVTPSIQSLISSAADAKSQGSTLGAVSSLNSLMTVIAPLLGAPLLGMVADYPQGDWRIGAPFYFCASLQSVALLLAVWHFRRNRLT
jgi:MFS transporter, DHA1 family, tetracycline resistance protein